MRYLRITSWALAVVGMASVSFFAIRTEFTESPPASRATAASAGIADESALESRGGNRRNAGVASPAPNVGGTSSGTAQLAKSWHGTLSRVVDGLDAVTRSNTEGSYAAIVERWRHSETVVRFVALANLDETQQESLVAMLALVEHQSNSMERTWEDAKAVELMVSRLKTHSEVVVAAQLNENQRDMLAKSGLFAARDPSSDP
jgi:hypothetical protein